MITFNVIFLSQKHNYKNIQLSYFTLVKYIRYKYNKLGKVKEYYYYLSRKNDIQLFIIFYYTVILLSKKTKLQTYHIYHRENEYIKQSRIKLINAKHNIKKLEPSQS
jgi:hypothetical protein